MPVDSSQPTTADIRRFLTEFFSDEEISTLCFDYFRDVYDDFASGMTKGLKIQLLIERCERRGVLPNLLAAIQRARPEPYKERFPQIPVRPGPPQLERDPRQVFISHAHQETNFAHRLAKDLQRRGWRVWIAPDSIRPGEKWGEAIDRGLGESGVFVAVLSPAAVQSHWVKNETYVAIELESKGHIRFVPLDVERCDVPGLWSVYQRVSFLGGYADGLKELLADLEQAGQPSAGMPAVLPRPPQMMGAADAFGKTDQQIPSLAKVPEPLQGSAVLSAYLLRAKRNPLPFLLGGAGTVALAVVLVIVAISGSKSRATPTPLAVLQPTLTPAIAASPPATQPTNVPAPTTLMALPAATPGVGFTRISEKDGMVMVYVPAGEFLMGSADSDSQADSNEKPQHMVYLDAFWIDRTEVTNAQYKQCVQAGKCKASSYADNFRFNDDNQPAVGVDWNDAQAYCQWAGRQSPTEAQWEKATRGTDNRLYPWGNQRATCEYAVIDDGSGNGCGQGSAAWTVGSKPEGVSPYGALDMAGNVWEWVADWYDEQYYTHSPSRNPSGPSSGQYRVLRGGSWDNSALSVRAADRYRGAPTYRLNYVGFRCSRGTSP